MSKTIDAMKMAQSPLRWHHFGDCRADADPLPTPAYVDHLLNEAIAREQAQTVEPVAWISKHGLVYPLDAKDEVHPINELQPLYLHPAQPPSEPAIKLPLSTERAALIAWQHDLVKKYISLGYEGLAEMCKQTADMLEADAREIESIECDYTDQVVRAIAAEEKLAQQVAVNRGCQYPMCHSEKYQQAVTAQITAELWTGVVVPPGYALVPLEPTPEMIVAGRNAPMCLASASNIIEDYIELYKAMLAATPQGDAT